MNSYSYGDSQFNSVKVSTAGEVAFPIMYYGISL